MATRSPDAPRDRPVPDARVREGTPGPDDAHRHPAEEILCALGVRAEVGLAAADVRRRRQQYGPNALLGARPASVWTILAGQLTSLLVWLLAAAAALSFLVGEMADAAAILAVLLINTAIGFTTELTAVRSVEALRRMVRVDAKARRAGRVVTLPAQDLVPGDIVLLEAGDVVPADIRLLDASGLECDESVLTGESVPVAKTTAALLEPTALPERTNVAFKGTAVTRGVGEGVVVATGMTTEFGRIASMVAGARPATSPLERRLAYLGVQLAWLTLGLAALVVLTGLLTDRPPFLMIQMGIALAVAAVPEGLPIVVTVVLARGMWRMARRNALIEHLPAVETLGATTVICTDKTGTLTENRMTVSRLVLASGEVAVDPRRETAFTRHGRPLAASDDPLLRAALEVAVLCNDAHLPPGAQDAAAGVGDPTEIALLMAGARAGIERTTLVRDAREVAEHPFDPERKMMATVHGADGAYRFAVKGAPAAVLGAAGRVLTAGGPAALGPEERGRWEAEGERLAAAGLRVLALATKTEAQRDTDPYRDLTLLGLVGLQDPPRPDVDGAIAACRRAGVRVVMVTGDHAATALAVARAVGLVAADDATVVEGRELESLPTLTVAERRRLLGSSVFARVSPRQKLDLIALYQAAGEVVAMTGDGVNDAPALEKADIGIAMGRRGTDVALEAADMVLRDDRFESIVAAMEQGRIVFANLRTFVVYLLSCNLSEILVVGVAAVSGLPLPILPLQILYLNLITDVFPAFALGVGEGTAGLMREPPRDPRAAVVTREAWLAIGAWGALLTAATLTAFTLALAWLDLGAAAAVSVAFLTLAFGQLGHVFNMRDARSGLWRNEVTQNPFVWAALGLCTALLLVPVEVPVLATVLGLVDPGPYGWALVALFGLLPVVAGQLGKLTRAPRTPGTP
jgi:P-type Ca2+ transporter type 2C